nr:response regulator transcription factor [Solimonas marina]
MIEDDPMLGDALSTALTQDGWDITRADDADSGRLQLLAGGYAAVLLDLGLPRGSGLDLLREMRRASDATPVLIVTARDRLSDRIRGLDFGADDYITKPFEVDELCARLRAAVRRGQGRVTPTLSFLDVVLEPDTRAVTRAGRPVRLSLHEFRTLLALMERQGRIVTRETLESCVYDGDSAVESNTIAVYIHALRRKLGERFVTTVHGFGYRVGGDE